jgi:hypothetical protein
MYTKLRKAALSILTLFLVACSQVEVKTTPPATPTQAVSPATDYVVGFSELPPDKLLFVLVKSESSGSGICDFPVVEQGLLSFRYASGTLEISLQGSATWLTGSHLTDVRQPEIIGLGFFGYLASNDYSVGGGTHNEIYYIDELPYAVPSLSFVIHSVLKDGTIVAGVRDQVYQFEPNQSWREVSSHREEKQPDCQIKSTFSITNYGYLKRSDVKFVDEAILP